VNTIGDPDQVAAESADFWDLHLYVMDSSPKARRAIANLTQLCEAHLNGRYELHVIDLAQNPTLARSENLLATPTLVRRLPEPMRRFIGDLSDTERLLVELRK